MKVLSMTWGIYDERLKEFQNDYTGGGLVIRNICEYIGRLAESYLFIGKCHLTEQRLGNFTIVGTDFKLDETDNDRPIDETYLQNMTRKFEMSLDKIKPDIVNFHGLGVLMQRCIQVCRRKQVPYVYTEHLYIGLHSNVENYGKNIEWEQTLYRIPKMPIIAVSQGMKREILHDFPAIAESMVHVIPNGTDFIPEKKESDFVEYYHLSNKKVLLCVGSIQHRKNQMQLIDVYKKLSPDIQNSIKIIFCGRDCLQGKLQECIARAHLEENLIYVGAVSSEEMKKFYSVADGLIMPSLAEGLSIAALEAIAYGLPVVMFSDLEGAEELNDEEVVSFAEVRSDESLMNAIIKWFQKNWDRDYIIQFGKYFSMERMAEDYMNYYRQRLKNYDFRGMNYDTE